MVTLSLILTIGLTVTFSYAESVSLKIKRSEDLSATHSLITDKQLPRDVIPTRYFVDIRPNLAEDTFTGSIKMNLSCSSSIRKIILHAHIDLNVEGSYIKLVDNSIDFLDEMANIKEPNEIYITKIERMPRKSAISVFLNESLQPGRTYELELKFNGQIWQTAQGLFKGGYIDADGNTMDYWATNFRPNNARRLFPCFDEPSFKVPYRVSISRPKNFTTLFNTELIHTENLNDPMDYVVDYFKTTPPMAPFSFGFFISQFKVVEINTTIPTEKNENSLILKVWGRPDIQPELFKIYQRALTSYLYLRRYFEEGIPICKIDIVAAPGIAAVRPIDNWGLIIFKESMLLETRYYELTQEILYQWIGSWITPLWWSESLLNKALASYLASYTAIETDGGKEFAGKYPMTVLYSLYYEFSKRYPHSRITAMKQETAAFKIELILRMLNYTLGKETVRNGLRTFVKQRRYSTFQGSDVWTDITTEAHIDGSLPKDWTVNEIAESWIEKDRLPVVQVERNYADNTAKVSQKVYLRERPHDVPEQDKMLWWIPLVVLTQENLNFSNLTLRLWMNKVKEVKIENLPKQDKFVIVNPEEIGPFPVNYDQRNWNLLSEFLQTEEGRLQIPAYTRAKLLHDAWNLAYAGDLSFATALNMSLFMRFEREHLVWNPVFTFIDHIGRHIEMSDVHKKFEIYIRTLLTPFYEDLGPPQENEEHWKADIRSVAKTFLCRAGYKLCVEEAQTAFRKWMQSENPDDGNPVPNQFICPVFKWGSQEEWEFGLNRVVNFPHLRTQSERTYLLKTLAGCPIQPDKIENLLNITILERNNNFTENDLFLILNMLAGGSHGYTTLFNFLSKNWVVIKEKIGNQTSLWNSLISSATGMFTTQQGYDMVRQLYSQKRNEFGTAAHIVERSLKNIKEESKWSNENLPVIEKWLDNFLKTTEISNEKFMN